MIQPIVKDVLFLAQPSTQATSADQSIGQDLLDTLRANLEGCVGLAANMIGQKKRIIVFCEEDKQVLMYNPVLLKASEGYQTEEGCLSLSGVRPTKRYRRIKVQYQDEQWKLKIKTYTGWTAQIIQHELDHCEGIII